MPKGIKGSGNPNMGRPKGSASLGGIDGRIAARKHAEKAMKVLVDLLSSPSHQVRVSAATQILDRAFGRPSQEVIVDGEVNHNHQVKNEAERFTSTIAGLIAREGSSEVSDVTEH